MFRLSKSAQCPIGIDVGTHALRLVQFRPSAEGLCLQAASRVELEALPAGDTGVARLGAALRQALTGREFRGKSAVLALPVSCVHAKSVRLPPMPDSDLQQALQWEAKDRFGFDIGVNAGQLVWFRAGEVRRGTEIKDEILLFAVEGGVLNEYIQCVSDAGLKLAAVDLGAGAIYRSVWRPALDGVAPAGVAAILDIGHLGSQFFIVRGEDLVFYKYIDIGGQSLNQVVATKLGISVPEALQMRARMDVETSEEATPLAQALTDALRAPLEELTRELDMCMRYYVVTFRGTRPETIMLAGRQAGSLRVRQTITTALGLQVEEAQPLRGVQNLGTVARPDRSGEWALAAGLALYPTTARAVLEAAA